MTRLAGIGVGAAAMAEVSACATTSTYTTRVENGSVSVELEVLAELMGEGNAAIVNAPGLAEPILILRSVLMDGALVDDPPHYSAIGSRCTHLGCRVRPAGQVLTCPCHGSAFGFDGAVRRGPAQKPLSRYDLEIRDGWLIVQGV